MKFCQPYLLHNINGQSTVLPLCSSLATGTEGATPDPGFRLQPIFKAVYTGKVTPDQRYSVPDGMEIRSCSGTCSMTFGSNLVSGIPFMK